MVSFVIQRRLIAEMLANDVRVVKRDVALDQDYSYVPNGVLYTMPYVLYGLV